MENVNIEFLNLFKRCKTVNEVKKFIELYKPDVHFVDEGKNNAFMYACPYNQNLDIIKYLVNDIKIDIHRRNKNGNNGLMLACKMNNCLEIIQYLIEDLQMTLNSKNEFGLNPFLIACMRNANPKIIKYLSKQDTDINYSNQNINGLLYACMRNENPEVIECLINDIGMNRDQLDIMGNNGFILACTKNSNVSVIKKLIELNYDIHYKNLANINGFIYACSTEHMNVIKYLIEETETCVHFLMNTNQITTQVADKIKKLDHCFQYFFCNSFNDSKKITIIKYLIEKKWTSYINNPRLQLKNINDIEFDELEKILPYIDYEIEVSLPKINKLWKTPYFQKDLHNLKSINVKNEDKDEEGLDEVIDIDGLDFLCKCTFFKQEYKYYGHRLIVFNMIPVFAKMILPPSIESKEGIHLKFQMKPKVFEEFLKLCYTGKLDIEDWNIDELINLIGLVDMYENKVVTVNDIEPYILDKMKDSKFLNLLISLSFNIKSYPIIFYRYTSCVLN